MIRILASAAISLIAIVCGAWLLAIGREIPVAWWGVSGLAVGGVVGADVITTYLTKESAHANGH